MSTLTSAAPVIARPPVQTAEPARLPASGRDLWVYAGAVLTGAVVIVLASIRQPYNQNELLQMAPYGSDSVGEIVSGTRQPPLDPLLGAIVQHLLGVGQMRQRLVPAIAGICTLVLLAWLLRRVGTGVAGAAALWLLATMPLFVRYSAYTRPYALPLCLMLVFVVVTHCWLTSGRRGWLLLVGLAAVALPLSRVPEPTVFLLTVIATMVVSAMRHRIEWRRAIPPAVLAAMALLFAGVPMVWSLAESAPGLWDPHPSHVIDRLPTGFEEFTQGFLPLMGRAIPFWPLTLSLVALAFIVPASRRILATWWFFWPLTAAPIVFVLAYHFLSSVNFDTLPYRTRAAYFFAPPIILAMAALASACWNNTLMTTWVRAGAGVAFAVTLCAQLPALHATVSEPDVPDFGAAAALVNDQVSADDIVLFDRPGPPGSYHITFQGTSRYLADGRSILQVTQLLRHPEKVANGADIYLLVDGDCTGSICAPGLTTWNQRVQGWRLVGTADVFALYAPRRTSTGRAAAADGLLALSQKLGPEVGGVAAFA
ncbi:MAG: glycosyltransferase family 39 protein, partial [Nocardioidaceae bacterium]